MGKVKLTNLTPHEIVVFDEKGEEIMLKIPPSGQIARGEVKRRKVGEINGIPVYRVFLDEVKGVPFCKENTVFIVSKIVQQEMSHRHDLVSPDTSPQGVVRDNEGKIIGVKGFQVI